MGPLKPTVTKIHAHTAAAATARNRTTLSAITHHCLPTLPPFPPLGIRLSTVYRLDRCEDIRRKVWKRQQRLA
jgi:hypothetical protein